MCSLPSMSQVRICRHGRTFPGSAASTCSGADMAGAVLDGSDPCDTVNARTSTPVLCRNAIGADWIRVGDAAMAVDPLSGNGIFQSLSSALVAPAVINTLLRQPDSADLARHFYQDRLDHLFMRFARTGRDFYRMEGRWPDRPFWAARQSWPDDEPMHQANDPAAIRVEDRPIVCDGTIQKRPVVITKDQPLGIWRLGNIELAPVILAIAEGRSTGEGPPEASASASGRPPAGPQAGGPGPASGSKTGGNGAKMRSCGFSRCQGFDPEYGQVRIWWKNVSRETSNAQLPTPKPLPTPNCPSR